MKKFISTRFAVSVFDEEWLNHRIKIFETITLPSFEQTGIINDQFYWVLLIDIDMPQIPKKTLINLVANCSISANIHILEVDYYFEFTEVIKDFIKKNCSENETIIQARFDSDDAISIDFFKKFDEILAYTKSPALITFSNIYEFWINDVKRVIKRTNEPFFSMNTFLITDNREITSYQTDHDKMGEWAKSIGYKVLIINNTPPLFLRLRFTNQTGAIQDSVFKKKSLFKKLFSFEMTLKTKFTKILYKLKQLFLVKIPNEYIYSFKYYPISILTTNFGINLDKLNEYYKAYPITPKIGYALCHDSQIYEEVKKVKTMLSFLQKKENLLPAEISEKNFLEQKLKELKHSFIKERMSDRITIGDCESREN